MASIFKRKYTKVVNGKKVKKQSLKYYTRLTDADGIKRTIPLFRDKTASQQRAAQLQKEIELARAGVVDRYKEHRKRPLNEHLEDFRSSLQARVNGLPAASGYLTITTLPTLTPTAFFLRTKYRPTGYGSMKGKTS